MKAKDFDLKPVQILMDKINDTGCKYAHLDMTSDGEKVWFNFYTPHTLHHRFTDVESMIAHLEMVAGDGEKSLGVALARAKVARLNDEISEARSQIEAAEEVIRAAAIDADGVPI